MAAPFRPHGLRRLSAPRRRLTLEALEDRLAPATNTWTGLGSDTNWSTVGNWSLGQAPQAGDDLVFPANVPAGSLASSNNLPAGTEFNSISFSGSGYTLSGSQVVLGSAAAGSGSLLADTGASNDTIALDVQLGGAAGNRQFFTVNASATLTVSGQVSGTTGVELVKEGTGTLIFPNANSYTGPTTISQGVLNIRNNDALGDPSSGTVVDSSGTLQVQGGITFSSEAVTLNGSGFANQGALESVSGNNTWARALSLDSDSAIGVDGASDRLALVVPIDDGGHGFGLTKTGPGELAFDTAPTYTGLTTITQGTVDVPQGVTLGDVALNGGTLAGRGSVGQLLGPSGGPAVGTVSPGDPLAPLPSGVLTSGNATWGSGTTFAVDLSDPGGGTPQAGTDYDQLVVNGNINLGGAALAGVVKPGVPFGVSFTVVRTTGGQVTGRFAEPFSPNVTFIDGNKFQVDYTDPTKVVLTRVRKVVALNVSPSPNPSAYGQDVTFSAQVVPEPGAGSVSTLDTVLFRLDGQDLQTVNVGANGVATLDYQALTGLPLGVGTHSLVAVFGGDSDFMGQDNSQNPFVLTVNPGAAQMSLAATPSDPVFGQDVTVTATIGPVAPAPGVPTGSVSFTVDGQPFAGNPAPLDANATATITLSGLGVGTHAITATYSGDANFQAITTPPSTLSLTVSPDASRVVLVTTPLASVYGQAVVLTAETLAALPGSGTPSGTVTFFDAGHKLGKARLDNSGTASLRLARLGAVGTHHLSATFTPGNADFFSSTGTRSHQVRAARTTAAVASSINPAVIGQAVTFTSAVRSSSPSTAIPQGTVTFTVDGKALATVSLNARGTASLTRSNLSAGVHRVYATYHPSSNFLGSTDRATPLSQQVR